MKIEHLSAKCLGVFFYLCMTWTHCFASPPINIPEGLYSAYTMDGQIPVAYNYRDDSYSSQQPIHYTPELVQTYIDLAKKKQVLYYGATDTYLYNALDTYIDYIKGKNVAVMGSVIPWYESILINYDAKPTTIEYNKIVSTDSRLETMTVEEYDQNPRLFDAILSISSFEHDGLGRYGDPLNPVGDLVAMNKARTMLKPGGLLFLAVPVAQDLLVWNSHRIYGKIRLKALLQGWQIIQYFGFTSEDLERNPADLYVHQPVFVLKSWY